MAKSIFTSFDNLTLQEIETEAELIPLLTPEDEEALRNEELPTEVAILPLRNTVLFPGVVIPITVGRDKSIQLIKDANKSDKIIGVVAQKDQNIENPSPSDLFSLGTVAQILRVLKMPDGNTTVIIQGKRRFEIQSINTLEPYLKASIKPVKETFPSKDNSEFKAIIDSIKDMSLKIIHENPNIPSEASFAIKNIHSHAFLINFVSSNMNLSAEEKQRVLSILDLQESAIECLKLMNVEYQKLELKNDIQSKVRTDLDQQQREYYLNQQMKTIQEELGVVSFEQEVEEMRLRSQEKKWDKAVGARFEKELTKLQRMNPQVAEYSVQRNYLDLFLDLPWNEFSEDKFDLIKAQKILDPRSFWFGGCQKANYRVFGCFKIT